jgi:capsid protein
MIRERGYEPEERLAEIELWNEKLDKAGVVLDSDPRQTSQQGQEQASVTAEAAPATAAPKTMPAPKAMPMDDGEDP